MRTGAARTVAVPGALMLALLGTACGGGTEEDTVTENRNARDGGDTGDTRDAPAAYVEVDVFSGRPNPGWHLPPSAAADIAALIQALPPAAESAPADGGAGGDDWAGGLGFRGFVLTGLRLPDHPGHDRVRVRSDAVRIETGDETLTLPDAGGSVHAALRDEARTRVPEPVYRAIPKTQD